MKSKRNSSKNFYPEPDEKYFNDYLENILKTERIESKVRSEKAFRARLKGLLSCRRGGQRI